MTTTPASATPSASTPHGLGSGGRRHLAARRRRSSTRTRSGAATAGSPRAARSSSTPARHTGRSPKDKFVVREPGSEDRIWWGEVNQPLAEEQLRRRCARRSSRTSTRRIRSTSSTPSPAPIPTHRIGVRVVTGSPYHALFAKTMFIEPTADELEAFEPTRSSCTRPRSRPIPDEDGTRSRHVRRAAPDAHRGADRRHVLRGRDQEVDLHGDERPAAARGRPPDALLGERRRGRPRRGLLRALGHGQDDALRRPRALADRRRRARLGRQRRLQHRGRLLREGDPALGRGRAARSSGRRSTFGTILENVVVDERGVLDLDDDSKTENTRAAYKLEQIANALPTKRAGHPSCRRHAHRGRLRDPAADRAAHARPGDVLLPLRLHGEARRHRDRRHRAAADLLDLLRRAVPAAAAGGLRADARREARRARRDASGSSTRAGRAGRSARATGCRSPATRGAAARRALGRARRASSTASTRSSASRCRSRVPGRRRARCSIRARPGPTRTRTTRRPRELAAMFRDNFDASSPRTRREEIAAAGPTASDRPAAAAERHLRRTTTRRCAFYRDVLGMDGSRASTPGRTGARSRSSTPAGRRSSSSTRPTPTYIDEVEVGRRVAGHVRVAIEVDDVAGATEGVRAAGAIVLAEPTRTPWDSLNARFEAPAGLQLTLFEELGADEPV